MTLARNRGFAPLALLATAGLVLAACGSDDGDDSARHIAGDASAAELEGLELNVGAKDFTENILLGEMLAQALEARGAAVGNRSPRRAHRSTVTP